MAEPGIRALETGSDTFPAAEISLRFELSWRSLTRPLRPTPLDFGVPVRLASCAAEELIAARAAVDRAEAREWELVVPRMIRPSTARPAVIGRSMVQPSMVQPSMVFPSKMRSAAPRPSGTVVVLRITARPAALLRRLTALAGAFLLLTLGFAAYRLMRPNIPPVAAQPAAAVEPGWIVEWASDPTGAARGRQLALYRPSLGAADYDLAFSGRIERQSLGWVFRAADASNYYAVKLEAAGPGNLPAITHFAVVGGVEGPHVQRTVQVASNAYGSWKVKLEARGHTFTVRLQDRIVEEWDDTSLPSGGVGFLNEKEELGQAQSIRISFLKGKGDRQ
jgi:hypothetical protein